jgi:hypothetical protein
MKYKLSVFILGLTFVGISQASTISWITGGFSSVQFPSVNNADSLSSAINAASGNINLTYGTSLDGQLLFNVVLAYVNTSNTTDTIPNQPNSIAITDGTPAAAQNIIISYLNTIGGTIDGNRTHVLSGASPSLFFDFANGDRLTIGGITVAANSVAPGSSGNNTIGITGNLLLSAPEPGTCMLLGSSLIGLGLFGRRRKTVSRS